MNTPLLQIVHNMEIIKYARII